MRTLSTILDATTRDICTVDASTCVCDAVVRMSRCNVGCLLVLNSQFEVVGVFSERDLLVRVVAADRDPSCITVDQVMTQGLAVLPPSASLEEAMEVVLDGAHQHLIVAEGDAFHGLVSATEIGTALADERNALIGDLTYYITH